MSAPQPPRLVPRRPADTQQLRQRALLLVGGIGAVLLLLLVLWGLWPGRDESRAVVLVAPAGSRLTLDGRPVPTLGSEGNHLLRLEPGEHQLELRLRSDEVVEHELQVEPGEGALRLELRHDKRQGRWSVVDVDAQKAAEAAAEAARQAAAEQAAATGQAGQPGQEAAPTR